MCVFLCKVLTYLFVLHIELILSLCFEYLGTCYIVIHPVKEWLTVLFMLDIFYIKLSVKVLVVYWWAFRFRVTHRSQRILTSRVVRVRDDTYSSPGRTKFDTRMLLLHYEGVFSALLNKKKQQHKLEQHV